MLLRLSCFPSDNAVSYVKMAGGKRPIGSSTAAAHGIDFLLTWNCRQLANGEIIRKIQQEFSGEGVAMPIICTPEELMGDVDV